MENQRPKWLLAWQDYPHSNLSVEQARELNKYCIGLERTILDMEAKERKLQEAIIIGIRTIQRNCTQEQKAWSVAKIKELSGRA